jgi:hypothetical protein
MANLQKAAVLTGTVQGDGTNTTFQLDLLKDPYFVIYEGGSDAVLPVDWFTDNPLKSQPSGVYVTSPDSASLSGTVISYTFGTAPAVGPKQFEFTLLFPA